jgi:hypothetical protein
MGEKTKENEAVEFESYRVRYARLSMCQRCGWMRANLQRLAGGYNANLCCMCLNDWHEEMMADENGVYWRYRRDYILANAAAFNGDSDLFEAKLASYYDAEARLYEIGKQFANETFIRREE